MFLVDWLRHYLLCKICFLFDLELAFNKTLSFPLWVILLIQLLQSGAIVAISVWIGMTLSSKVNLHSPCFEAIANKSKFVERLRPQLKPGFTAGFIVGVFLIVINYATPSELIANAPQFNPMYRIFAEVFYGGITEEILMRWGLMTLIFWILWRFIQGNQNHPSHLLAWISIVLSSLLFALGHIPAANALVGHLTVHIVAYVMIGNTVAGIVISDMD